MIYEFQDLETGESVELAFSASEVPSIGDTIEHEGRSLVRLPSRSGGVIVGSFGGYASITMPRWTPHAKNHDDKGRALVGSKREELEIIAKINADERVPYKYEVDRD